MANGWNYLDMSKRYLQLHSFHGSHLELKKKNNSFHIVLGVETERSSKLTGTDRDLSRHSIVKRGILS
jgi:hypothetical protein